MSMQFSTPEQIEKAQAFLDSVEKPACNCKRGVIMCYHTPCLGTVDDMEKLLDAGYAKNLMLDFFTGGNTLQEGMSKAFNKLVKNPKKDSISNYFSEDVQYLAPAIIGHEGKLSGYNKAGTCNLLKNNLCSLHDLGLKPVQGRYACCSIDRVYLDEYGKQQDLDERLAILITWNTQRGKDLIERWKKEVNFQGSDKAEFPSDFGSMMSFLKDALGSHEKTKERMKAGGCPEISDEDKERPVYTRTYEKPY